MQVGKRAGAGSAEGKDGPQLTAEILQRLGQSCVNSPLGAGMTDAHGRVEWVNDAYLRKTGYRRDEVLGKHPLDLLRGAWRHKDEITAIRAQLSEGRHAVAELQTETAAGSPYWTQFWMGPGIENGEIQFFTFLEDDITERRRVAQESAKLTQDVQAIADDLRAERELLSSVLSTIPQLVFWKDGDHRYLGCNQAYARLRGVADPGILTGHRESELAADQLGSLIAALEEQVLVTGEPVMDHSVILEGQGNEQRVMLVSLLPRSGDDSDPEPRGLIGVGMDVTRITALERQLAQATRLESIGQLAAGLAHEINTPIQYVSDNALFLADSFTDVLEALRSIANVSRGAEQDPRGGSQTATVEDLRARLRLLVDGLDLDFLGTEIPSALEQTLEGIARVAEIVRAMKEFSHPGQGRVDTDINHAIETTAQVSRNEWKYVAEMDLDLDQHLGLVPCYEGEFKQVVLNLIVNAAHAIAERQATEAATHPGRIGISTRRDGDTVSVSISDDGAGMTEDTKLRIFDPFFTTKEVGRGTGQGLAMAHACIVGKHEGSIEVFSELGAGTTFRLNLPAAIEARAADHETNSELL